ncbi:MAG: choice-of-anchor D domain-containing protein [Leptospira sp.]|nr:choice-of-anchor D domain-containing protein [Leptospira sp.]
MLSNCIGLNKSQHRSNALFSISILSFLAGSVTEITETPSIILPPNSPAGSDQIVASTMETPDKINSIFIPIGKVFEIGPGNNPVKFVNGKAEIRYKYNPEKLKAKGLTEDFNVFYFDKSSNSWKPVEKVTYDPETHIISAFTSHLTPFIPAATAPVSGGTQPAPACILADFPSGIQGSGGAEFITIGESFQYYKDRIYTVVPLASSPNNTTTFAALGFMGALGVSTCNGNLTSQAGCTADTFNKLFTGIDYIRFTAQMNIDVYLMYDTRGGATLTDTTRDAAWIAAKSFTDTGYYVQTTDAVGLYRVYKKTYSAGQLVVLDGNRNTVGSAAIQTNYWLIIKRQGIVAAESPTTLCATQPTSANPVINLDISATYYPTGSTYNFAAVPPTQSGTAINFAIRNSGGQALNLTGAPNVVSISGVNASDFTVTQPSFPVAPNASATYTITFSPATAGAKTATINIPSDDPNVPDYQVTLTGTSVAPPTGLSYSSSAASYTVNNAIPANNPTVTGTGITFSVLPALPAGLSIDSTTGIISGTPTTIQGATNYTITANNATGNTNTIISIAVVNLPPPGTGTPTVTDIGPGRFGRVLIDNLNSKLLIYGYETINSGNGSRRLSLYRCNLNGTGCTYQNTFSGLSFQAHFFPIGIIDSLNSKLVLVFGDLGQIASGGLFILHCDLDGANCSFTDASAQTNPGPVSSVVMPYIAIDSVNGKLIIAYAQNNASSGSNDIGLMICNLDGTGCVYQNVTNQSGSGLAQAMSIAVDSINSKILIAGTSSPNQMLFLYRCELDGTGCSYADVSSLTGRGTGSGLNPSMKIDSLNGKLLIVTDDVSLNGADDYLSLFRCNLDLTGCTYTDVSVGQINIFRPSLVIDAANAKLLIGVSGTIGTYLNRCNIDGSSCTSLILSNIYSYGFRISDIDTVNSKFLMIAKDNNAEIIRLYSN